MNFCQRIQIKTKKKDRGVWGGGGGTEGSFSDCFTYNVKKNGVFFSWGGGMSGVSEFSLQRIQI